MRVHIGHAKEGDIIIMTLGVPVTERGTTNALRVYRVAGDQVELLPEEERPLRSQENVAKF